MIISYDWKYTILININDETEWQTPFTVIEAVYRFYNAISKYFREAVNSEYIHSNRAFILK